MIQHIFYEMAFKKLMNMDVKILEELYKIFFFFFCLQMVGAVHRKDCGRRLDASCFSHCCQRH